MSGVRVSLTDLRERIITLDEGEYAPVGYYIARVLATGARLVGPGANHVTTYTVAIRPAALAPFGEAPEEPT